MAPTEMETESDSGDSEDHPQNDRTRSRGQVPAEVHPKGPTWQSLTWRPARRSQNPDPIEMVVDRDSDHRHSRSWLLYLGAGHDGTKR